MAHKFPSEEWVAAFRDAVNGNTAYRTAGASWTYGVVALVVKPAPAIGLPEAYGIWLDLHQGVCRGAKVVSQEEAATAPFCISGEYGRWKEVIRRQLEPIKGMMQKKLEVKGPMTVLVKHVQAAKELVESATRVPTQFLDE